MPLARRVLILGGTVEARDAATALTRKGFDVTLSLAGVTQRPLLPESKVRRGGFGGAQALAAYVMGNAFEVLVDATHPFAAQMSSHAYQAALAAGVPLLRLERLPWQKGANDNWTFAQSLPEAINLVPSGAHIFVTTGRRQLEGLLVRRDVTGVIRTVEALEVSLPSGWQQMLERPPYDLQDERVLMGTHGFTHVLTKNAGGASTFGKIEAARSLGLPVIMVERPAKPPCTLVNDVEALLLLLGSTPFNV